MNQDNLEKYIADHRSDFDSESPPPMVWMNIEKALGKEEKEAKVVPMKTPTIMRIMQVAAMFVVVMGVGLLIGLQLSDGRSAGYDSNPNLQEFVEAERHYSKQIDKMWTAVKVSGVEEQNSIQEDLNALDEVYQDLRNELLNDSGQNTDEVVNAMIENYRTKIDILETVLTKTKQPTKTINLRDDKVEI